MWEKDHLLEIPENLRTFSEILEINAVENPTFTIVPLSVPKARVDTCLESLHFRYRLPKNQVGESFGSRNRQSQVEHSNIRLAVIDDRG